MSRRNVQQKSGDQCWVSVESGPCLGPDVQNVRPPVELLSGGSSLSKDLALVNLGVTTRTPPSSTMKSGIWQRSLGKKNI